MSTLFQRLADTKANEMLANINENRSGKEKFNLSCSASIDRFVLYMAVNGEKEELFNVLTDDGELPSGMSACWRNFHHIKQDLGL